MPKAEPAVHLIRRKAIDPPDEPLALPARFTTGAVVVTANPLKRDHLATVLAKRARIVPATYLPTGPDVLDRAAGVVREETVIRIGGRKRIQSRIQRLETTGDAPLPTPLRNKYYTDRDHSQCPRPEIVEPPRVVLIHETGEVILPPREDHFTETEWRIAYADTLLWWGMMPAAVRAEVRP